MSETRASGFRRARVPALFFVLLVAACGKAKTPTEPVEPVDPTATFTRVQAEIFTPSCALSGCHAGPSPQQGMDLSAGRSYGQIVGVKAVESTRPRIAPGDPASSYLVSKVAGDATITGSRMPLGGPYLSDTTQKLLADWVRRGAPND
ncbi:MAG: hypothetical protein ACHQPI_12535 [Thermoanaerobaculia bacterium]